MYKFYIQKYITFILLQSLLKFILYIYTLVTLFKQKYCSGATYLAKVLDYSMKDCHTLAKNIPQIIKF